jgi:hypothetical protein
MTQNDPEVPAENTEQMEPDALTEQTAPPAEPEPKIYLGADGGYHDNTPENRELFPSQADVDAKQLEDVAGELGAESVPFTEDGKVDGEALAGDTMTPAGDDANGATSPEAGEVVSGEAPAQQAKATSKTRTR